MGGRGFGSGGRSRSIGLRVKIGHKIGKAPFSNKAQNEQFKDAIKGKQLTPQEKRLLHDEISGQGYGYHEIVKLIKDMFGK